jgi:hypothetical protein
VSLLLTEALLTEAESWRTPLLRRAREAGKTYRQALRQLANGWGGSLHHCLATEQLYEENIAWVSRESIPA